VEEARQLDHKPTVLFFYCRNGDNQRDNFVAVARGLLSQLLKHNRDLLPYFYEESFTSAEANLTSPAVIRRLLDVAIKSCKSVYIILDGLDECPREERKMIAQWFRDLVEELPPTNPEAVRYLFISQDDGAARKDFGGLALLTVTTNDNKVDIEEYSSVWAGKVRTKFELSEQERLNIAASISVAVGGMVISCSQIDCGY